jgi:hypothetical protein
VVEVIEPAGAILTPKARSTMVQSAPQAAVVRSPAASGRK